MLKTYSPRDLDYVSNKLMPKISRTFYLTLQYLPEDLRQDCIIAYAFYRVIDNTEDSSLSFKDKIDLMNEVISSFSKGDVNGGRRLQKRLSAVKQKKEGYAQLMRNYSKVISASKILGGEVVDLIAQGGREMADGLANPEIQRIETLDDHHRYCHYAAAVVGYFITKDLAARGYISEELATKLMPSTHDNNPFVGVNPAHDLAVALQLTNNIRDLHEDQKNGIFRWPTELLARYNLNYDSLTDENISGKRLDRATDLLAEQIEDAKMFFPSASKWIDSIPYDTKGSRGIKFSWGSAVAFSAATLTKINSSTFFTDKKSRKLPKPELFEIGRQVNEVVSKGGKVGTLVSKLLDG